MHEFYLEVGDFFLVEMLFFSSTLVELNFLFYICRVSFEMRRNNYDT